MAARGFIERHGLWDDEQRRRARDLPAEADAHGLHLVRLAWADPHGAARAKSVSLDAFGAALADGYNINVATSTLDASGGRVFSSFTGGGGMGLEEMTGSPNLVIVPDPGTSFPGRPASAGSCATSISGTARRSTSRRGICCGARSSGSAAPASASGSASRSNGIWPASCRSI